VSEWYGKDGSYEWSRSCWLVDFGISNSLSICLVDARGLITIILNMASWIIPFWYVNDVFDVDVADDVIQVWKSYNECRRGNRLRYNTAAYW